MADTKSGKTGGDAAQGITDKMKALMIEGTHFLRKPYTQHQLQDSVKDLLAT